MLCVVFGASGVQGNSVIRSILASPQASERIRIRGVCRDTNKPAAKHIESLGIELVAVSYQYSLPKTNQSLMIYLGGLIVRKQHEKSPYWSTPCLPGNGLFWKFKQ
jgi:hypothetical protein